MGRLKEEIERIEAEEKKQEETRRRKEEQTKAVENQEAVDEIVNKMISTFERDFFNLSSSFDLVVEKVKLRNSNLLTAKEAPIPEIRKNCSSPEWACEDWDDFFDEKIRKHPRLLDWKKQIDEKFEIKMSFGVDSDIDGDEACWLIYKGIRVYMKAL